MKIFINKIIIIVLLITISCDKDDEPMVNQAPKAFTATPTVIGNSVTLNWTAAEDPEGATVKYNVILDGEPVALNKTQTNHVVNDLDYSKTYEGKILAFDPEGLTSEANFSFSVAARPNTAPTAVVLRTPVDKAKSVTVNALLVWEPASDAEGDAIVYDVYLDESSDPVTMVAEGTTDVSYHHDKLLSNTTLYWKVVARDAFNAESMSEVRSFETGDLIAAAELATDNPGFSNRAGHTSVVFNDKMWVIGGASCCGGRFNDVWSSSDGINWTEVTEKAEFAGRVAHSSVVFDGKIWVTGGNSRYSQGSGFSDVWFSVDGETWKLATDNAAFGERYHHEMIVYDNKMWIIGGRDQNRTYSTLQVWNSTDGENWTLVTDNAGVDFNFSEFTVFNDKIWRIGNYSESKIYSSTDGVTWNLEAENAPYGQRHNHKIVEWDNKIWLVGGSDKATNELLELPDVWYTENGKDWYLAINDAGFQEVGQHTLLPFNDKIWIIAGGGAWQSSFVTNDIWALTY